MGYARALVPVVLTALLWAGPATFGDGAVVRAATGPDCRPQGQGFSVPPGQKAVRFRVLAQTVGRSCEGNGGGAVEGFSIRRGATTLFVSYRDAEGRAVSDPLPLASLSLSSGEYTLCAAPAAGAAVALAWELEPDP